MTGDRKLLLVKNSKAGCTSLAALLEEYATGELVNFEDIHLHRNGVYQGAYDWREFEVGFRDSMTISFSFVRDPEKRLMSCFFDFFVDLKNGNTNEHIGPMQDRGFSFGNSVDRNFEVFVEYVSEAIMVAPNFCNRHWREQVCNLGDGLVKLDFVGKLENYESDLRKLFELIGERSFLDRSKSWHRRLNTSTHIPVSVSAETRRRIIKTYARDYEAFGY